MAACHLGVMVCEQTAAQNVLGFATASEQRQALKMLSTDRDGNVE